MKFPSVAHSILVEDVCKQLAHVGTKSATARPKQTHSPLSGTKYSQKNHHGNPLRRFTWNIISYLFKEVLFVQRYHLSRAVRLAAGAPLQGANDYWDHPPVRGGWWKMENAGPLGWRAP